MAQPVQNVILSPKAESKTTPFKSFKDVVAKHRANSKTATENQDNMDTKPQNMNTEICDEKTNMTNSAGHWQWHDVYRWILQLNEGQFVKYNKSLYDGLCSQNITGQKLRDLTSTDWLVLGVTNSIDIQAITAYVAALHIPENNTNINSNMGANIGQNIPNISNIATTLTGQTMSNNRPISAASQQQMAQMLKNMNNMNTSMHKITLNHMNTVNNRNMNNSVTTTQQQQQQNMWVINGNVVMNQSYFNLFCAQFQQTQQSLTEERTKRVFFENALSRLQCQSGAYNKAYEDALSSTIQQYHAMAQLSGSLQTDARSKEQELVGLKGEHDRLMAEYEVKVSELEKEMRMREELEGQVKIWKQKWEERDEAQQRRYRDLDHNYGDLEGKYNALHEEMDHLRRFRRWDFNEVYLWINGLEDGYFGRKYVDLYDHLEIQQVTGMCFAEFGVDEIARLGIEDVVDQRRLLANIRVLLQNGSDGTAVTDSQEDYDYANIDLFDSSNHSF